MFDEQARAVSADVAIRPDGFITLLSWASRSYSFHQRLTYSDWHILLWRTLPYTFLIEMKL